jgi:hypothetical protein
MGRKPKDSYILKNPLQCGVGHATLIWEPQHQAYYMKIQITPRAGFLAHPTKLEEAYDTFNAVIRPMATPVWTPWPQACMDHYEATQQDIFAEQDAEKERQHQAQLARRRQRYRAKKEVGK